MYYLHWKVYEMIRCKNKSFFTTFFYSFRCELCAKFGRCHPAISLLFPSPLFFLCLYPLPLPLPPPRERKRKIRWRCCIFNGPSSPPSPQKKFHPTFCFPPKKRKRKSLLEFQASSSFFPLPGFLLFLLLRGSVVVAAAFLIAGH